MLPYIDEHAIVASAAPLTLWRATVEVISGRLGGVPLALAAGLGCAERAASGDPRSAGATVPGFRVVRSQPPTAWVLEGEHRFSRYEWGFFIEPVDHGRARVRAQSRAAFRGVGGSVYRGLVIGTRGHAIAVRHMLHMIKHSAERSASASGTSQRSE